VDTGSVTSNPAGIRVSPFFGYPYSPLPGDIMPGKGYWVKTNAAGKLYFASGPVPNRPAVSEANPLERLNTITITDAAGVSQTLYFGTRTNENAGSYEMPPAPPAGAFDARFDGGQMVQTHPATVEQVIDLPILIQSSAYPLTVSWKVSGSASYELNDGLGGEVFASRAVAGEGTMKITGSSVSRVVLRVVGSEGVPSEYALMQNYPNPFNPTTNIRFALPVDSRVTVEIYNMLGQKVRTLFSGDQAAGYHVIEWNGTGSRGQTLGSGVYFLQMSAAGSNGRTFSDVRKLIMLK
jgi:hypothetical protein